MSSTSPTKKTLIYNWVEERQSEPYEGGKWNLDGTLCTNIHRQGHEGIISTTAVHSSMETSTTSKASYNNQPSSALSEQGQRELELQQKLYKLAEQQVMEENKEQPIPPQEIYETVMKKDYVADFTPQDKQCSRDFEEDPATYWRQNMQKITGISPVPLYTRSPFARNATFSTPIQHSTQNK